jgi:hypothetical protein
MKISEQIRQAAKPSDRDWNTAKKLAEDPATKAVFWDVKGVVWYQGGPGGRSLVNHGTVEEFLEKFKNGKYADRIKLLVPPTYKHGSIERQALNKYNAVELMGALMSLLKQQGLDDAVDALKKVAPVINKSWMDRERTSSVQASNEGHISEVYAQAAKALKHHAAWLEDISKQSKEAMPLMRKLQALAKELDSLSDKYHKLDEQG